MLNEIWLLIIVYINWFCLFICTTLFFLLCFFWFFFISFIRKKNSLSNAYIVCAATNPIYIQCIIHTSFYKYKEEKKTKQISVE